MIRWSRKKSILVEAISKNPGINFREIMRTTGMVNGVVSHHVRTLEKEGIVMVIRQPGQTRFYPPNISDKNYKIISALRRPTSREILLTLVQNDHPLPFHEIKKTIKKSPATVSQNITQMILNDIIQIQIIDLKKHYQIKNRSAVDELLEQCNSTLFDRASDGLVDIMSSL